MINNEFYYHDNSKSQDIIQKCYKVLHRTFLELKAKYSITINFYFVILQCIIKI